ncbi:MAG TPA: quinone-dependent dihydroorotate dehydrogenase [Leeuwenhoekiella sp.]|nr:quinone-dependent dihydroorotate dehydrogenase [Leeuwenhoekiella sp.]
MYKKFLRPVLFKFDPEKVHYFSFKMIKTAHKLGLGSVIKSMYKLEDKQLEREVFGLKFKNPVGLAAGFDKDARLYSELSNFGFGFIEIGTLTPKPQPGNPKKRLFRLKKDKAIINRMGFNNGGVDEAVKRLRKNKNVLIGGNIGKNKTTPNEDAASDYLYSFKALFDHVDYFVVNVSSPNTPNLRALQEKEPLKKLLNALMEKNRERVHKAKPILLKIAPDLNNDQLLDIIEIIESTGIAGVIATNTTLDRTGLNSVQKNEQGGLSGKPLRKRATEVIRFLATHSKTKFPIVGVGGIHSAQDAVEKLEAGASLVQLYTGFIYEGPALIKQINKYLLKQIS